MVPSYRTASTWFVLRAIIDNDRHDRRQIARYLGRATNAIYNRNRWMGSLAQRVRLSVG